MDRQMRVRDGDGTAIEEECGNRDEGWVARRMRWMIRERRERERVLEEVSAGPFEGGSGMEGDVERCWITRRAWGSWSMAEGEDR